jgi:hypothetical protein
MNVEDLVELGYLIVHSRLGEHLERRGYCRLHCAGLALGPQAALILAPSGGGKSTLTLAALAQPELRILGDDMVLIDRRGLAHPFPSPIGVPRPEVGRTFGRTRRFSRRLHPEKWLLELDGIADRLERGPLEVAWIFLAHRVSQPPTVLAEASPGQVASTLFRDLVIGLGLPQVLELVARRGVRDLARLAPSAGRRLVAATALARRAHGAVLEIHDPERAMDLVLERLRSSDATVGGWRQSH